MTTSPSPTSALGTSRHAFGEHYLLERELGRGGMGTVYLARDLRLDRPVALKVLLPEFATQSGLRDRFLRETRIAASFSHPNIVPVYAVEESEGHLAYAMGLVEGETLTQRVERAGPLPVREIVRMLQDVAYALAYAHGRGVVHRDIKPDNVMIERSTGRALVLDFGISRSITSADATSSSSANLTRVGEVVGTPEYMSPEQASGDLVDGRSDLYSLGLTAFFAASGTTAMAGESTQKILVRQLTEQLAPASSLREDLPPALATAIDNCIRKDPAERYQTAEALIDDIDAAQLTEPVIPLAVRLFAGELSTLTFATLGIAVVIWLVVRMQQQQNMMIADTLLPVVALLAILGARVASTLTEGRRLAESGFSSADILGGMARVVDERATRRTELYADPRVRRRRQVTLRTGGVMVLLAIAMVLAALSLRVRISPTKFRSPPSAVVMVFLGYAMFGAGIVQLVKSPFRMPPGERIFRWFWIGRPGRAVIGLLTRNAASVSASVGPMARPVALLAAADAVAPGRRPASTAPASAGAGTDRPRTAPSLTNADNMTVLEARVDALEQWRRAMERP